MFRVRGRSPKISSSRQPCAPSEVFFQPFSRPFEGCCSGVLRVGASSPHIKGYQYRWYKSKLEEEAKFILDIKFVGRTSRGYTGGRSHRISHPPSFCGACLTFSREKDSAIPFPRRPRSRILCTDDSIVLHSLSIFILFFSEKKLPGFELTSQRVRRLRGYL